jgi:hypothetical protein
MKRILRILLITAITAAIAGLYSCEDSLGIDPNTEWVYLDPDTSDPGDKPYEVEIKNAYMQEFLMEGRSWQYDLESTISSVFIDTSESIPRLIINDLEMRSMNSDQEYIQAPNNRTDRIVSFRIRTDTLSLDADSLTFFLDGEFDSGRYFSMKHRQLSGDFTETDYSGLGASYIGIENKKKFGYITLYIGSHLLSVPETDTKILIATCKIYY